MEFAFFGSGVLWLLITFPAYWLYQWTVEGEPFSLWRRSPGKVAAAIGENVHQGNPKKGASLSSMHKPESALEVSPMS